MPAVGAWAAAVALAAVSAFGLAVPQAQAHAALVDSSPADGDTVEAPLSEVELVFNEPVQSDFAQITVIDQNDTPYEDGDPSITGDTATQRVADLPNGTYTISYRIVSADGHPVTGSIKFTVTGGSEPSGNGRPTSTHQAGQSGPAENASPSGTTGWVAVGALVVVALAVGAVALRRTRNRPDAGDHDGGRDTVS